ncbi:MAG: hypothetical protein IRZ08_20235 [Frankia sp.]|nr:hypothetical protein [Frankia sp.]
MELVQLAKVECNTHACPAVYAAPDGSLVVQGYVMPVQRPSADVPEGEAQVRIPRELLLEAARELVGRS